MLLCNQTTNLYLFVLSRPFVISIRNDFSLAIWCCDAASAKSTVLVLALAKQQVWLSVRCNCGWSNLPGISWSGGTTAGQRKIPLTTKLVTELFRNKLCKSKGKSSLQELSNIRVCPLFARDGQYWTYVHLVTSWTKIRKFVRPADHQKFLRPPPLLLT
jgi:hypothetical protein